MTAAEHHRDILQRLEALAAAHPEVNGSAMEFLIQDQRRKLAAAEATEAITAAPTGETTLGYQKSATGAMEPRTVDVRRGEHIAPAGDYRTYNPVGNVQKPDIATPKQGESRAFWPDIRIDPPYDR